MSGIVPPALVHEAIRLVRACVPSFAALSSDPSNFKIDALTLGTTNQLVRVTPASTADISSNSGVAVVVRFYGAGTDRLISRDSEVALQSLFLKTFKKFPNALVYEFLEGMRELDSKEFNSEPCVGRLTRLFAGVHSGVLWRELQTPTVDGSKKDLPTLIEGPPTSTTSTTPSAPLLSISSPVTTPIPPPQTGPSAPTFVDTSLTNWVSVLLELGDEGVEGSLRKEGDIEVYRSMGMTKEVLLREVAFIRSVLTKNADLLPLAVCHNDLNCFNILANKIRHPMSESPSEAASSSPSLTDAELFDEYRLIDFEYSGWGHVYFDIGNHFNEFAGVDVTSDFSLSFPDDAFIERWLRKYFGALQRDIDSIGAVSSSSSSGGNCGENGGAVKKDEILTWLSLPSTKAIPTTDEEYAKAVQLTKFFSLVSHFMWSVWSVIQATQSMVDFGFVPYGKMRWCRYLEKKEEFTKGLLDE